MTNFKIGDYVKCVKPNYCQTGYYSMLNKVVRVEDMTCGNITYKSPWGARFKNMSVSCFRHLTVDEEIARRERCHKLSRHAMMFQQGDSIHKMCNPPVLNPEIKFIDFKRYCYADTLLTTLPQKTPPFKKGDLVECTYSGYVSTKKGDRFVVTKVRYVDSRYRWCMDVRCADGYSETQFRCENFKKVKFGSHSFVVTTHRKNGSISRQILMENTTSDIVDRHIKKDLTLAAKHGVYYTSAQVSKHFSIEDPVVTSVDV